MIVAREDLFHALVALGQRYTYWRFGQLIENVCLWTCGPAAEAVATAEDAEILTTIREHLDRQGTQPHELLDPDREDYQDPALRHAVLQAMAALTQIHPDWRFGQLVANLTTAVKPKTTLYDIEDRDLLAAAQEQLAGSTPFVPTPALR